MGISLIIAIYKRLDFLSLVLQSIELQSFKNFELIVAEDDNQADTIAFIAEARKNHSFSIKHVHQEDLGFRKNKILNEAIRQAKYEKLVFIDGDCLLHRHFLKNYDIGIKSGIVRAGRRIELSRFHTKRILRKKRIYGLNLLSLILNGVKYPEKALFLPNIKSLNSGFKHLLGCNWGIMKHDIESINGFDEDYELSGVGEDSDVEWRILKKGLKIESIVYSALQYHMYHPVHYKQKTLDENLSILKKKKELGNEFCANGLTKSK